MKLAADKQALGTLGLSLLALFASGGIVLLPYLARVVRTSRSASPVAADGLPCLVFGKYAARGEVDRDYRNRLDLAHQLLKQDPRRLLVLLGGFTANGSSSEAQVGLDYLRQQGWAGATPLLEESSTDTLQNLRHARSMLSASQHGPVILVSNRYHLARCSMIASSLGIDHCLCAAEDGDRRLRRYLAEAFFLLWFELGKAWARLTRNRRMLDRVT